MIRRDGVVCGAIRRDGIVCGAVRRDGSHGVVCGIIRRDGCHCVVRGVIWTGIMSGEFIVKQKVLQNEKRKLFYFCKIHVLPFNQQANVLCLTIIILRKA